MALDRDLALARVDSPLAISAALESVRDGWALLPAASLPAFEATGWEGAALIVRAGHGLPSAAALSRSWDRPVDRYALLERHGALVVSPCQEEDGGLLLAGGSYSRVSLHVAEGVPIVRKRLRFDERLSEDRELRQLREIEWLSSLPAPVAELFAPVLGTARTSSACELTTRFVVGYTLAELVFQGRLSGRDLADLLSDVYATVSAVLWPRAPLPVSGGVPATSYVQRTRRRIAAILASGYPDDGVLRRLLLAESVIVNGRRCLGIEPLLTLLEREGHWAPVVNPVGRTLCHGDLILEDILVAPEARHGFCLVDPNPLNENPIYDLGKTMMSLWLGYELIYFDRFSAEWSAEPGATPELRVEVADDEAAAVYDEAAEHFLAYVERRLHQHLQLPRGRLRPSLRMSAAIHMLAITVFHLLHHRREQRAVAFVATALLHAQHAL